MRIYSLLNLDVISTTIPRSKTSCILHKYFQCKLNRNFVQFSFSKFHTFYVHQIDFVYTYKIRILFGQLNSKKRIYIQFTISLLSLVYRSVNWKKYQQTNVIKNVKRKVCFKCGSVDVLVKNTA